MYATSNTHYMTTLLLNLQLNLSQVQQKTLQEEVSSLSETDALIPTECKEEEPLLAVCRSVAISNSASLRFPICVAGGFKALRVLFDFYNSTGLQPVLRLHNSVLPEKM
jgi:hypothetical protein